MLAALIRQFRANFPPRSEIISEYCQVHQPMRRQSNGIGQRIDAIRNLGIPPSASFAQLYGSNAGPAWRCKNIFEEMS